MGSLVLSVSDSQCHPPFPYRLRRPASQPASLPSHPYREARQRSTHALFSEPFQSSLLPLATSLNSSPPRTAHPGSSGTSGQPHLLPGLTPTRSSSTYNASSPHMLFPVSNSLLLGPAHLSNSCPLSKMQFYPVLPLPNSPGPPCSVLLSTQYPLVLRPKNTLTVFVWQLPSHQ